MDVVVKDFGLRQNCSGSFEKKEEVTYGWDPGESVDVWVLESPLSGSSTI